MDYRYNRFTKFFTKQKSIIIKLPGYKRKVKLDYKENIYNFFLFLEEKTYITKESLKKFNITKSFLKFLIKIGVLIKNKKNSGMEAICFDKLLSNPTNLSLNLEEEKINEIYRNVEKGIGEKINSSFKLANEKIKEINQFKLNSDIFNKLKSTRLKNNNQSDFNLKEILSIIHFVFEERENKKEFGVQKKFFKYGSGGGLNSIFPMIITKNDLIYIFDKMAGNLYQNKIDNIYKEYIENCLIDCKVDFYAYDYFILLLSDTSCVFEKYGNKGYRLLHLEGGQISFMFRLLSGKFEKPYLEVQGIYEENIYELIRTNNIFKDLQDLLLLHTIAITD